MRIPTNSELQKLLAQSEKGEANAADLKWLATLIDHTLLKRDATPDQLKKHCEEAKLHSFFAVCVHADQVEYCVQELQGSGVRVVSVTGFPTGNETTAEKIAEAQVAIKAGAAEIDMMIHVENLKLRALKEVFIDIQRVASSCGLVPLKVILETSLLSREEIVMGSALAKAAGAAFLKTSTGFSNGGARVEDVNLMRDIAGPEMGVKASGGVRTQTAALQMVIAGANRIGTSSGVAILSGSAKKADQSGVY